mgnify:CR=1 FL=1
MSVRHSLLALLEQEPMYGYQLRAEFESRTGSTWPLNVGQVYTTLDRLERDGLVTAAGADDEGRALYAITPAGREDVRTWFQTPVGRSTPPRDELAIKLALAVTRPGVDVRAIVQAQPTFLPCGAVAGAALRQEQRADLILKELRRRRGSGDCWLSSGSGGESRRH